MPRRPRARTRPPTLGSVGVPHRRGTRLHQLETYLRDLATRLNLAHWDLVVSAEVPEDPDSYAEVLTTEDQHATLSVAASFWTYPSAWQRLTIVHELCHLRVVGRDTVVEAIHAACAPRAAKILEAVVYANEEYAVEGFARLLAPTLPLPPRFKQK